MLEDIATTFAHRINAPDYMQTKKKAPYDMHVKLEITHHPSLSENTLSLGKTERCTAAA
mgnify:CR=1 FL=1